MSAAGKWRIEVIGEKLRLELQAAGPGKLKGKMGKEGEPGGEDVTGTEEGDEVHLEVTKPVKATFDGKVTGNKIEGTAKASGFSVLFEGTRI
jgi:predicted RNA-binding protein with TRAM domain